MVSIDKIKRGLSDYIDTELLPKTEGAESWIIGVAATLIISELDGVILSLNGNKLIEALHLIDKDGNVDIEKLYPIIRNQARRTGPVKMDVPLIGTITLSESDIEQIYRKIMTPEEVAPYAM